MNKFLLALLCVVTCFLTGCKGLKPYAKSGFSALPVGLYVGEDRTLRMFNRGKTLHNVRIDIGSFLYEPGEWARDKRRIYEWTPTEPIIYDVTTGWTVTKVDVTGWCDEGRIKGFWTRNGSSD